MLRGDVLAGIAVTAMIVPKDLGYAGIAGVPVQNGLYAAAAGAIVYALFCTSRHISTGPSSSLAAVAGGAVLVHGRRRRAGRRARRGDHARDRRAVPAARGAAPGLDRAVPLPGGRDRLPRGSRGRRRHRRAAEADRHVDAPATTRGRSSPRGSGRSATSAGRRCSSGSLALAADPRPALLRPARAGRARARRRGPARHVAVRPRRARCRARRATCRAACPRRRCRALDVFQQHYSTILAAATGLLLIGFSQTAGDARAFAVRHRYRIDVNQESVAQGMANVAVRRRSRGCRSRRACRRARSTSRPGRAAPMASLVTGGLVLLTLVALAPLFSQLPKAVLAAIIIDAVVFGMIDIPELRRLYRVKRFDFWIAAAAIVGVLSAGVLAGVVIGIALSLVWLVYVATTPGDAAARPRAGHAGVPRRWPRTPATRRSPASPSCGSTAACSSRPPTRSRSGSAGSRWTPTEPLRAVVLDLEGVDFVDSQGAAKLAEILDFAESVGDRAAARPRQARRRRGAREGRRPRPPRPRPHPRQRPPRRRGATRRAVVGSTNGRRRRARAAPRAAASERGARDLLLALIKDSDSVELKVTVPESEQRSAIAALGLDPLEAQIRQVFFFDTPDLALERERRRRPRPPHPGEGGRLGREAAPGRARRPARRSCAGRRASSSRSTRCRAASSARRPCAARRGRPTCGRPSPAACRCASCSPGSSARSTPRTRPRGSASTTSPSSARSSSSSSG